MPYDTLSKADFQRTVSQMVHAARGEAKGNCASILFRFARNGTVESSMHIDAAAKSLDATHRTAIERLALFSANLCEAHRMDIKEISGWLEPHFERLTDDLLAQVPTAGFPLESHRTRHQLRAIFVQRSTMAIQELRLGIVAGKILMPQMQPPFEWKLAIPGTGIKLDVLAFWKNRRYWRPLLRRHPMAIRSIATVFLYLSLTTAVLAMHLSYWPHSFIP